MVPYFAYGTTQQGFPHHRELYDLLGEPVARVRTVEPYAIVVPHEAACSNPGCRFVHRMAALVRGHVGPARRGRRVPGRRRGPGGARPARAGRPVHARDRSQAGEYAAQAYPVREPERWIELVRRGRADALPAFPRELADANTLKPCCAAIPGHPPPHDVVDPS